MRIETIVSRYIQVFTQHSEKLLKHTSVEKLSQGAQQELSMLAQGASAAILEHYRKKSTSIEQDAALIQQVDLLKTQARIYQKEVGRLQKVLNSIKTLAQIIEIGRIKDESKVVNGKKTVFSLKEVVDILTSLKSYLDPTYESLFHQIENEGRGNNPVLETLEDLTNACEAMIQQITTSLAQQAEAPITFPYRLDNGRGYVYPQGYTGLSLEQGMQQLYKVMRQLRLIQDLETLVADNSKKFQQYQLMHIYLKQNLDTAAQNAAKKVYADKNEKPISTKWKDLFFITGARSLEVLRNAEFSVNKHISASITADQFITRNFENAAGFSGSTYTSIQAPEEIATEISPAAIATIEDCFAITKNCNDRLHGQEAEEARRVTGALAKGLVRVGNRYDKPEEFIQALPGIFQAQPSIALGKVGKEAHMKYITGLLVKSFTQESGAIRVITSSIGGGVVLAIHPDTKEVNILSAGNSHGSNLQDPIHLDDPAIEECYQQNLYMTDSTLEPGSILLAFTDEVLNLFKKKIKADETQYTYVSPSEETVRALFEELFAKDPHPTHEHIRYFLLKKLLAYTEEARKTLEPEKIEQIKMWIENFVCSINSQGYQEIVASSESEDNFTAIEATLLSSEIKLERSLPLLKINNFLTWLNDRAQENGNNYDDNKQSCSQSEIVCNFLSKLEIPAESYDDYGSLNILYQTVTQASIGGEATLFVKLLGESRFLTQCRQVLAYFDAYLKQTDEQPAAQEEENKLDINYEDLKKCFSYIFDKFNIDPEKYQFKLKYFCANQYGKGEDNKSFEKLKRDVSEWLWREKSSYEEKSIRPLFVKFKEILSEEKSNIRQAYLQAKKLLQLYKENRIDRLNKEKLHLSNKEKIFLMSVETGVKEAGNFFAELQEIDTRFTSVYEASYSEEAIDSGLQGIKDFSSFLCGEQLGSANGLLIAENTREIKLYFIAEEIMKLLKKIEKRLPDTIQEKFSNDLLKSTPQFFLEGCKIWATKAAADFVKAQKGKQKRQSLADSYSSDEDGERWDSIDMGSSSSSLALSPKVTTKKPAKEVLTEPEVETLYAMLQKLDMKAWNDDAAILVFTQLADLAKIEYPTPIARLTR